MGEAEVGEAEAALEEVLGSCALLLEPESVGPERAVSLDGCRPQLLKLIELIQIKSFGAQTSIRELRQSLESGGGRRLEELESQLNRLDYEAAMTTVESLLGRVQTSS